MPPGFRPTTSAYLDRVKLEVQIFNVQCAASFSDLANGMWVFSDKTNQLNAKHPGNCEVSGFSTW